MKREFILIDVLRFFLAFLVVCVHVKCALSSYFMWITPIAVPSFFAISGFLMWQKSCNSYDRAIGKILKITIISYLIYLPVYFLLDTTPDWHKLANWINMFLFNMPLGMEHLWYLLAYLYVLFVIRPVKGFLERHPVWLFFIIVVLLMCNVFLQNFGFETYWYRNWLLVGIPYFLSGFFLRFLYEKYECSFLSISYPRLNHVAAWGTHNSLDIYILHPLVFVCCGYTLCKFFVFRAAMWWFGPFVIFLLTWGVSVIIKSFLNRLHK